MDEENTGTVMDQTKVVDTGRTRTAPRPGGIEWEKLADGSYRYYLIFGSVSGQQLRLPAEPKKADLKPDEL